MGEISCDICKNSLKTSLIDIPFMLMKQSVRHFVTNLRHVVRTNNLFHLRCEELRTIIASLRPDVTQSSVKVKPPEMLYQGLKVNVQNNSFQTKVTMKTTAKKHVERHLPPLEIYSTEIVKNNLDIKLLNGQFALTCKNKSLRQKHIICRTY